MAADPEAILTAVMAMRLREFTDVELTSLNLAVEWGAVPPTCHGYAPAVSAGLLPASGRPDPSLVRALTHEVLRRWPSELQPVQP